MDYQIAIPSYKRPETIKNKTLKLLMDHNIDKNKIPQDNIEYIVVALHDKDDNTLYRKDISGEELSTILSRDIINIWVEGEVATIPEYYVVWPYSTIDGWCERLTGNL